MSSPPRSGPPPLPELPEGVEPPVEAPPEDAFPGRAGWPRFVWWSPIVALASSFFLAAFVYVIIAGVADAASARIDFDDPPTGVTVGATLVQNGALIGFAVLFGAMGGGRPRLEDFGLRRIPFWRGFGWAAACFVAFYAFSFFWSVAVGVEEQDDLAQELGADESASNLVAVALLVAVAAPLGEEFFFRGFLFQALGRRFGLVAAAVGSGLVFGLIHAGGTDAVFLVPLAVFGLLLALLFHRTGSLLPCIALHALNNAIALGVTLDWLAWQVLAGAVAAPAVVLALAVPLSRRAPRPAYA